jgi:TonB family protein
MQTTFTPIATSTTLTALLHGAVFASFLFIYEPPRPAGRGVEIQLISSAADSQQQAADEADRRSPARRLTASPEFESVADSNQKTQVQQHLDKPSVQTISDKRSADTAIQGFKLETVSVDSRTAVIRASHEELEQSEVATVAANTTKEAQTAASTARSNNASGQQQTIITLLHQSISSNKEYPYMAVRQRREGVARVGFVLHPDGSVKDAHLVASSTTRSLDRAALTAVKHIDPFQPAQQYLEHAQSFEIDVVFELL